MQHAGLALAIGLGACLNAGLLYYKLRSHDIYQPLPGWPKFMVKVLVAVLVMSATLWFTSGSDMLWLHMTAMNRALHLTFTVCIGAMAYFMTLWLLGFRLKDFSQFGTH